MLDGVTGSPVDRVKMLLDQRRRAMFGLRLDSQFAQIAGGTTKVISVDFPFSSF